MSSNHQVSYLTMDTFYSIRDEILPNHYVFGRLCSALGVKWACNFNTPVGPTLTLGQSVFKILPVCSTGDHNVILYSERHPSGIQFEELNRVIEEAHLPLAHFPQGDETVWHVAFKLTAVISRLVRGAATFCSVDVKHPGAPNSVLWVIIMKGLNKTAKMVLKDMASLKDDFTPDMIEEWYDAVGIGHGPI